MTAKTMTTPIGTLPILEEVRRGQGAQRAGRNLLPEDSCQVSQEIKMNGKLPWFIFCWRLPWVPVVYAGLAIAWFGIAMAVGLRKANRFWQDALWQ